MNNDIGSRIDELITSLKIKKVRFAERLGIDQSYVTQLTSGRRNPSDLLIGAICREFNVNEKWLRTGEGGAKAMFLAKTRDEEIAAFLNDLRGGPDFRQKFISVLSRMTEDEWAILEKKVLELAQEVQEKEEDDLVQQGELIRSQHRSEKEPDTQASSVKESGAV